MARPKGSLNKKTLSPLCTEEGCDTKHFCKGLCKRHYQRTKKYPEYTRAYNFKYYNTGWTLELYEKALLLQDGKCAICNETPERSLHADHNHETEKPRELLCSNCNSMLGMVNDNINRLKAAISYLEKHT